MSIPNYRCLAPIYFLRQEQFFILTVPFNGWPQFVPDIGNSMRKGCVMFVLCHVSYNYANKIDLTPSLVRITVAWHHSCHRHVNTELPLPGTILVQVA